jgi:hypothetical protein
MAAKAAAPLAQFAEAIACRPTAGEFDAVDLAAK